MTTATPKLELAPDRPLESIPGPALDRLRKAARAGEVSEVSVWWVGGGVRDHLLARSGQELDLDLVVVGDLDRFAGALAASLGAPAVSRSLFLTRELRLPGNRAPRVDVVRARRERYPAPAVLPEVEPATLEEDLVRRDFTVNSLAIPLHPEFGGHVVDVSGGLQDLTARRLRVHHARSFEDDPTRIFRAIDFASRLGFELDAGTEALLRAALTNGAVARLSATRLRSAMLRCFGRSGTAAESWSRAERLGALAAIHPSLRCDATVADRIRVDLRQRQFEVRDRERESLEALEAGWLELTFDASFAEREALAARLGLEGPARERLLTGIDRLRTVLDRFPSRPSAVHRALRGMSGIELAMLAARGAAEAEWVRREAEEMRPFRLGIDGASLIDRGVSAGPAIGIALERTRDARLDGEVGADEELGFALSAAREVST